MEVLTAIAGKIADLTVIPIGRQVEYLIFYKENMKELNENFEELKTSKVRIEHDIEAERRNGREIEADVIRWQNRVQETLEEVERLCEDEPHASVRCWKWSFPNLKSRHQLGRRAKKMAFNIVALKEKGKFDGRVGHVLASSNASLIFATRGSEKLESRNSFKKEVILSLIDPKVRKVGICGLPGLGKTTLAKDVGKHVKDDKLFDVVAMATISQTLDVKRVQDEIAYQLGFRLDEITSIGRAEQLCARIKMEKNILIILDDLWEKIDLEKLGIPPEQDDLKGGKLSLTSKRLDVSQKNETYQGCKLLMTSRSSDILAMNETKKNFHLKEVNYAESWSLFEDIVGDAIKDCDFKHIATQVVEKCAGFPVMIVSIANSLKCNKNISYWEDVLDNLQRVDNGDIYENVFLAFEFTYEQLKDDEMKKVFLLCGVEGPSMFVSDLLKYVIGLGILKHKDTIEDARNRLYRIIHELKASCLLLEDDASENDVIKMHDLVREVAVSIAQKREHVFLLKRNGEMQDWLSKGSSLQRFTQIILKPCLLQELPSKLDCPNLKFFHLQSTDNCTLKIPDSFFEGMGNLEALDLIGLIISSLPQTLVSLSKLKTLCLNQCTLKHLTGIAALKNLEILSFFDSSMEKFPSEIEQLAHLRMLDLSNSGIGIMPPNILSKLTKIEELYMGNASIKWEEESSAMENMKSKSLIELGSLTNLTTLEIHIREAWILSMDKMFDNLKRYKVVIGDKWEWSSNKRTSRLLKLKLGTSIHLEPGIMALIRRVEDLYLDEVGGISDVLLDLKGKGFPQLKHLHFQNNGQVQHIINTTERNGTHVLFPELETLVLHNLNNLEKICHGPLPDNSFCKLTIIKVENCDQLVYLLSVLMVKALSQLVEIQVSKCNSMKMILYIENGDSSISIDEKIEFNSLRSLSIDHLPVIHDFCSNEFTSCMTTISLFNDNKVSFSSLETLKLSSVNLDKIWDDGDLCAANCFHNLANLTVEDCRSLKHLFSSSVVGSLLKLKHLEISKCEMMEEIIAPKGINITASEEVRLSKLETMVIKDMKSLKKVWHFQFEGLKSLEVSNCGKLVNIFPSDMQGTFGNLETLKVNGCDSVEAIFQLTAKEIHSEDETMKQVSQLKKLHLLGLPKLKQIWSRDDNQANIHFHNLQLVRVERCENLVYLLPFSIAMQAIELEDITIKGTRRMKRIVSDKDGPTDSSVKFEFNHLTSLVLWNLDELEGLFARNHRILCPSLRKLDIRKCLKLKLFKAQSSSSRERVSGSELQISIEQPLFTLEEVICNLETLTLTSEDASIISQGQFLGKHFSKLKRLYFSDFEGDDATFPYWFLQNIATLTILLVEWSSFKEIFQGEIPIEAKGKFKTGTRIKKLTLHQLQDLRHICEEGFQIDPILEDLDFLYVVQCSNLKHLVPSSATFSHLTYLEVENCNGLIYLITSSTARSLVRLTTMKVSNCNSLEKVVAEEEGSEDEIALSSLEILKLECLPKIKRFCSSNCFLNLPLLEEVVVNRCPRMDSFSGKDTSTPKLQKISSKEDGKVYWEGDISKTLKNLFVDMVAFSSFNNLEFSEYPELKELWYGQVGQNIFCNLKHLVVRKCTFLSNIIFSSNLLQVLYTLEELEVAECDSLEAIFDVKAFDEKVMESKEVSGLKKLTLSELANLKHIWNREERELIVSFGNLQTVKVDKCQNLKCVFSPSLCQDLRQLEELNVESCGVGQIVANEEGLEELKLHFPLLRMLRLINLTQLNDFYPKKYILECPSLKALNISQCESLQIFAFEHLDSHQLKGGFGDFPIQQALFHIEKVPENLEEISLTEKNAMRIVNANYEKKFFQRIEILHLQCFQETPIKFLNDLIQKFPATTTLEARCCYFKTLFPSEEIGHCSIQSPPQIKTLWLYLLEKLEHIWNDNSALDTLVPNLEHLAVGECCRLIRLAPTLTSFTNLITLKVVDCNGLMNLMSPFTAKSLVHLTSLAITNCKMLEEVVTTDEGGPEEEIIFKSLKDLELTCLPHFKSFYFGKHTFIFPSLVTLKVTGCHKMQNFSSRIIAPFLKLVEVENGKKCWKGDLNTTINNLFLEKTSENLNMDTTEASSFEEQVGESKPDQIADIEKQDTQKNEASLGTKTQLAQVTQNAYSPSTNQNTELIGLARGTREMGENIERPLVEAAKVRGVYDADIGKQEIHKLPSEYYDTQQNKQASSNQVTGFVKGTQEIGENIETPLVDAAKIALSQRRIYDADIHDTMDKPLIQTDQDVEKLAMIQNTEESRESYTGTQKICNTIKKASISAAQDVSNSTMTPEAAIDPSPLQAPKPVISQTEKLNIYRNYKEMIDIPKQNMPYLEAGVNRHPQVLDWLNTKRRRVFASSTFSLFAEVTCILRTTRKGHMTEDDRSYIRECCTVLEAAKFDVSWLSYVHKCIEECGDAEDIKRKVEETKGQASSLEAEIESMKKELASVKESLVLLLDKARNLDDFIES
ncbi:hypothetical protein QN277_023340 [Acacia crassicarpa]|uniref:AAA+ ATPase domain-containing protein n=1 Tax=Acacia crassicarpa TaxID=499986 RepID=A0AAE1JJX8_9FABA|nr:hypothetical protein QN277_023340 [Acacia crassicarpa]